MLRLNAHEKAFEINVLAQRTFEREKDKMVFEGTQELKRDQADKVKSLEQDLNIKKSKKINGARLKEMKERNECLIQIKATMKIRLQEERTNNRDRYLNTVKELIK